MVRQASNEGWQREVANTFGTEVDGLEEVLAAEHIRAAVFSALAQFGSSGVKAVHSQRISSALGRNLRPWMRGDASSWQSRETAVRDSLAEIGDIYDAGDGYWLPGPSRLIECPGSDYVLILGGIPSSLLDREVRSKLSNFYTSRFAPKAIAKNLPGEVETLHEWLGGEEDIGHWFARQPNSILRQMRREGDIEVSGIEIFAPDLRKQSKLQGVWSRPGDHVWDSQPRQFRTLTPAKLKHTRQYYVGLFGVAAGELRLLKSIRVDRDYAARYRFGFDQQKGLSRTLHFRRSGQTISTPIKFFVPYPERIILAIGSEASGTIQEFKFSHHSLLFLEQAMARLGIKIEVRR